MMGERNTEYAAWVMHRTLPIIQEVLPCHCQLWSYRL